MMMDTSAGAVHQTRIRSRFAFRRRGHCGIDFTTALLSNTFSGIFSRRREDLPWNNDRGFHESETFSVFFNQLFLATFFAAIHPFRFHSSVSNRLI
jgi:hypothetical protein